MAMPVVGAKAKPVSEIVEIALYVQSSSEYRPFRLYLSAEQAQHHAHAEEDVNDLRSGLTGDRSRKNFDEKALTSLRSLDYSSNQNVPFRWTTSPSSSM